MDSQIELRWVSKRDYYEAENIPRAVECARTVAIGLINGWVDPLVWAEEVQLALEVLCDAPGGDPALALWAIKSVEGRFRRPERWEPHSLAANAILHACGATKIAEVAHRNERYSEAVVYTSSALDKLEVAAGGPEALMKLVASSKSQPLAGAAIAVDGIRTAALRRACYDAETKAWMRSRTAAMVPACIASGRTYPRSHAFATQRLFEQVEFEVIDHVDVLREISDQTRGSSKRSWATAPLVEMEHSRALGHIAAAKRAAKEATERIRAFGLKRHFEIIDRYGYLAFD